LVVAGPVSAQQKIVLEKPVQLEAGGKVIDTGKQIAHSGPLLMDFDQDGLQDLLVGNFRGTIQIFRNKGTNAKPVYEDKGFAQAGGKELKIHNW
jgi:hypothetical protein